MNDTLIGAIDQGTSSTRFLVINLLNEFFNIFKIKIHSIKIFSAKDLQMVTYHQTPITLITPKSGYKNLN
jgi:hypothetical protein